VSLGDLHRHNQTWHLLVPFLTLSLHTGFKQDHLHWWPAAVPARLHEEHISACCPRSGWDGVDSPGKPGRDTAGLADRNCPNTWGICRH